MGRRDEYFCDWCGAIVALSILNRTITWAGYDYLVSRRTTNDVSLLDLEICWICAQAFRVFLADRGREQREELQDDREDEGVVEKMGGPGGE